MPSPEGHSGPPEVKSKFSHEILKLKTFSNTTLSIADFSYSWNIIIILIITLIISNRGRMWVGSRGDQILIAQLHLIKAGLVTVVLCKSQIFKGY